jgi:hypothetical protein
MQLPPILQKDVSFLGLCSCRNRKFRAQQGFGIEVAENGKHMSKSGFLGLKSWFLTRLRCLASATNFVRVDNAIGRR